MSSKITAVVTATTAALALAGTTYALGAHRAAASGSPRPTATGTRHAGGTNHTVTAVPKGPPLYPGYEDTEEGNLNGVGCWTFFIAPRLQPGGNLTGKATMTFVGPNSRKIPVNGAVDQWAFYEVTGSLTGHLAAGGSTAAGTRATVTMDFPATRIPYRNAATSLAGHALKLTGTIQPMANLSGPGEFDMTDANQNVLAFWATSNSTFQTTLQQNDCLPPNYAIYHH
jgi:hypothetical protein